VCTITDHSLLRYIERVWHIDVEAAQIGCDTVKMGNGARLKLKGNVVATVLPKRGW
jgi:hypothetical protein